MANPKDIGLRIEKRRKELDLTLEEVASKVGVSLSTISRYERGEFDRIKLPVIISIANALSVSYDYLVCKSDVPFPDLAELPDSRPTSSPSYADEISPKELAILAAIRAMPDEKRQALFSLLGIE